MCPTSKRLGRRIWEVPQQPRVHEGPELQGQLHCPPNHLQEGGGTRDAPGQEHQLAPLQHSREQSAGG